ncbi:hypothetical protein BOTBODRAFT_50475 [Botryobasidium botryosum FD-172 SS1]|uniref:Peptidase A22B, signal peptide peptidase n=1 Tax=Botryobasidium botryosum (strain FD-172 SS1) TaxID=930990 RepID=A0A067NDV6_BOTB1|nr:hypothetical protein BOTBODRAFT_50475 [Botryobasidium botryosum FD-172 SS1]
MGNDSEVLWGHFVSYAGLLSLATFSIYTGAYSALPNPPKAKSTHDSDDEDELAETISSSEAYLFPVLGSVTLGGIYLAFKYLSKEWINWLFGIYFAFMGVATVWRSSTSLLKYLMGPSLWNSFPKYKLLVLEGTRECFYMPLPLPSLLLSLPSAIPSILYFASTTSTKPALLSNILALSFAHNAFGILKLDSFKTGTILLAGLFFYDIWWVFGTNVMVKVATSFDAPIKLVWPKSFFAATASRETLLGLGDIVIPGLFIVFALRYDQNRHFAQGRRSKSFDKPYFNAAMSAYVMGLATTMFVMHFFQKAQPALLYLSPACILSFVVTGITRGELGHAWAWTTDEEKKQVEESKKAPSLPTPTIKITPSSPATSDPMAPTILTAEPSPPSVLDAVASEIGADGSGSGVEDAGSEDGKARKRKSSKKKKA